MADLYKVLGVPEDASAEEIKAAYRRQAFALHPDTNPQNAGRAAHERFHRLQEAYAVLRDEAKRARYDHMRAAGFSGGLEDVDAAAGTTGFGTPWGQPSVNSDNFDAAFDEWWKRMSDEFGEYEEKQYARERSNAERMARAAAWEWEKEEAKANKTRSQRLKWRTEDARLQRHAATLRRFWQTHSGWTLGDALVAGIFLAGTAGIALTWRSHLRENQEAQQKEQAQQQQQLGSLQTAAAAESPS